MIIKPQNSEVESNGIIESEDFDIGSKEMVISLIRENIYKEPLLAFIREIAANARDANREIGFHKVPVKITLPNGFDNSIRIRDYGPGLSPERMKIYRGYGLSTKRDSNLQTGGFGLGAKSPFSYSEEFTISSITDENNKKVKRTYFAVKEGTGSTNLIDEIVVKDPNEKTGVEIAVPIKKNDIYRVKDIVKNLFSFWEVKPDIHPSKDLLLNDAPEILIDDPMFSLIRSTASKRIPAILLDGFHYSIDEDIESLNLYSQDNLYIQGASILFKFNTGEIDLAVSRDNIRFSKLTIKAIQNRIEYIHKNLRSLIVKKIESAADYDTAMKLFSLLKNSFSTYVRYTSTSADIQKLFSSIFWNKILVNSKIETKDIGRWCECYTYYRGKRKRYNSTSIIDYEYDKIYSGPIVRERYLSSKEDINRKVIDFLFEEDLSLKEIVIVCTPKVPASALFADALAKDPNMIVEYDQVLLNHLNYPKIEDVKLPEVAKVKTTRISSDSNYENLVGRKLTLNHKASSFWLGDPKRIPNLGGIYVLLDGNKKNEYIIQGFFEDDFTKDYISSFFQEFLDNREIYAFTKTRAEHLTKDWIPFGKAIKDKLFSVLDRDLSLYFEYLLFEEDDLFPLGEDYFTLCKLIKKNSTDFKEINEFVNLLYKLEELSLSFQETKKIISNVKEYLSLTRNSSRFEEEMKLTNHYPDKISFLYERIKSKYPLLESLSYCNPSRLDINHVIKYMRSC